MVVKYVCPLCDYEIPELLIQYANVDYDCPGCHRRNISEFVLKGYETEEEDNQ